MSRKGKSDSPDYSLISKLITAPDTYLKRRAHYKAGKDVLSNYGNPTITKGSTFRGTTGSITPYDSSVWDKAGWTPEQLTKLKNYKTPEGLLGRTVENAKFTAGTGDSAEIAKIGKHAMESGHATELGVTEASQAGVSGAGGAGATAMGITAILLGLGYGIGKRKSTLNRLFKGGRKD